jgi:hypothetical protein
MAASCIRCPPSNPNLKEGGEDDVKNGTKNEKRKVQPARRAYIKDIRSPFAFLSSQVVEARVELSLVLS